MAADEQPLRLSPALLPPPVDLLVSDQEKEEEKKSLVLASPFAPAAPSPFATASSGGFDIDSFSRDHLHCPSCGKYYDDPRTLPCLHTYCRECLKKEAKKQRVERERESKMGIEGDGQAKEELQDLDESYIETLGSCKVIPSSSSANSPDPLANTDNFDCPQGCQCPTGIRFDRVGDIDPIPPQNKFLGNMVEDVVRLKNEAQASKIPCGSCNEGEYAIANLECANLPLCSNCLRTHLKTSKTERHIILPLPVYPALVRAKGDSNESKDGGKGSPPSSLLPSWKNFKRHNWLCDFHPTHPVDRYCYNHKQVICLNCSILGDNTKGHRGCGNVELTEECVDREIIAVAEALDEVKGVQARIIKAINIIETMKKSLTYNRNWAISTINEHCEELNADVESQRESLINQTKRLHDEKMANLKEHQDGLKRISDTLQRSIDFIGGSVNMAIPTEFMFLKESFHERLNYLIDCYKNSYMLPSDLNDRIHLKLNDGIGVDGSLGYVFGMPLIQNYTVESFPNPVHAQRTYSFRIQARDICRTEVAGNVPMLKATICSLANQEPVECFVQLNNEEGVYTVYFQPFAAGRHMISVFRHQDPLEGIPVRGCPFYIDVKP